MCSLVYAGIIYNTLKTFSLPLYTMSTSIIITIAIDLRSDTEQQQPYIYLLHVTVARATIVLSYKPGSLSGPAGPCGISIGGRACSNSLLQRRDLPHRMILHLYKATSTSTVVWNTMGKIKKTNADKTQQGSNRWADPMQSSVFFVFVFACVFVFFSFSLLFFFLSLDWSSEE